MRDRLIELIENVQTRADDTRCLGEVIADELLANGVIVPPCKVGDKVYQTDGVMVYESTIRNIVYETNGIAFDERAIGRSIFLTREEAEEALERMKGGWG